MIITENKSLNVHEWMEVVELLPFEKPEFLEKKQIYIKNKLNPLKTC